MTSFVKDVSSYVFQVGVVLFRPRRKGVPVTFSPLSGFLS